MVALNFIIKIGKQKLNQIIRHDDVQDECRPSPSASGPIILSKHLETSHICQRYQAEIKLLDWLQKITRKNLIILHQLEINHQQYSSVLPVHQCLSRKCSMKKYHVCHKKPREIEGETDFLIIGHQSVIIFEVKGFRNIEEEKGFESCLRKAKIQIK